MSRTANVVVSFGTTLTILFASAVAAEPNYVWWEAESPKSTNFPQHSWLDASNDKERDALSGGRWICYPDGKGRADKFLEYELTVPTTGTYRLFVRKCWSHGPFRWRFDSADWRISGKDCILLETVDYKQFHPLSWVPLGEVTLSAGLRTFRVELTDVADAGPSCFDCFVLVQGDFTPNGKMRPGQKYNRAPEGWFPFEPDPDDYRPSPIDLRSLNEKTAGDKGRIIVRGDGFAHAKTGETVRFWGINGNPEPPVMAGFARFAAKRGVNLVRWHAAVARLDGDLGLDEQRLERLHAQVAAMKREGIYTLVSLYFPVWAHLKPASGIDGYTGQQPFSLLYFEPEFQAKYRAVWREVLTRNNPHTGLPLRDDPACAMLEIVNEDSMMFWTFNDKAIPPVQMARLESQLAAWLVRKYGGADKFPREWSGLADAQRARFRNLWEVANHRDRRSADIAEFLAVTQRDFYQATYDFLRRELGYPGLIQASNWVTADARYLGPLDKWSNTVGDYMDRHGYFEARHKGERAGYSLSVGDRYQDRSALLFEGEDNRETPHFALPIFDIGWNGKPSIISEINWNPPNRFRADMPILAAAYGLLQGSDGFGFFATGEPAWQNTLSKFAIKTPSAFGQFPAAALLYRKGLVRAGDVVVRVELRLGDLFALKGAPLAQPQNLDQFRKRDIPPGQPLLTDTVSEVDPLAFLVGRVEFNINETGGKSRLTELSKHIDRSAKIARSSTGELTWDWGQGVATINAPTAQGATGFLARAGELKLADARLRSDMEYGSVLLVPLDDKPIATSGKLLLQVMSEDSNYGWRTDGTHIKSIADIGGPPIIVRQLNGSLALTRPDAGRLRVTPLDANGYPLKSEPAFLGAATLKFRPSVFYYLIERI